MQKNDIGRYLFFALVALCWIGAAEAHGVQRLVNGQWWSGEGFVKREMYSVQGVLRTAWDGPVDATIDLQGKFAVPAYGDAHNHLFADNTRVAEQIVASLRAGVFYVANPNNTVRLTVTARTLVNTSESVDVIYANGGLTASGGHPIQIYDRLAPQLGLTPKEMEDEAYFVVDDAAALDRKWPKILEGKPDFIKAYLETSEEYEKRAKDPAYYGKRGLDPALLPTIVAKAHASGLRVAVHIRTRNDFRVAVESGADWIAHLPLERLTADDAALARERGTVVVTTVLSHRSLDGISDVSTIHKENLALLRDARVKLAVGVDGGHSAVDEVDAIAKLGVLSNSRLVELLVRDTPQVIFPKRKLGCLDDGCEASFLTLEGDPRHDLAMLRKISLRMKKGHMLAIPAEAPKKAGIADAIAPKLQAGDVDGAFADYARLKKEHPSDYDFSEPQLNALGYAALQHGAVDAAIRVFELNTQIYPGSFNVWDSLGEAWKTKGDKTKAIEFYRKAVELNPHYEAGKKILAELESEGER
ncbi:MAG: tetratricopeptide repeat protein [Thermoanaerobaculia bacterium]|jgi:tetratricopeptide (TPR) repeat protein